MSSIKNKIVSFFRKSKQSLEIFLYSKTSGRLNQVDIDKKLVYSLSPKKIPSKSQLKYLNKFLSKRESIILKICLVLILSGTLYLSFNFFQNNFQKVPVSGGTYIEGVVGYPKTINPLFASSRDVDNDLSRLMYSYLFNYNSFGELKPDLVADYKISENGTVYDLEIIEGVKWHNSNGTLSSDDIVFTFNLIQDERYGSPLRAKFAGVKVEKVSDYAVRFTLPEPYAPFLEMLNFGIMPASVWQDVRPEAITLNDFNIKPIGSGPYKFKTLLKNKSGDLKEYHLEVNESYYRSKPHIENIIFRFYTNHLEAITNFNENSLNALSVLPYANRDDLNFKDSIKRINLIKPQLIGLFFNLENDKFKEVAVRKALAQAIDKEELIENVYGGLYQSASGPILKTNFAYNEEVVKKNNYAPNEAKEFFAEKELEISITVIDINGNVFVAESVKNYWEELGLKVNLEVISLEQAAATINKKDFEVLLYGQVVGGDPDVYAFWHSSQTGERGLNISSYKNDEVDKLLSEARAINSQEDRINKYKSFQNIISDEVPVIFLYSPTYTYIQNKKANGFSGDTIISPADRFSQVNDWYIKTKNAWIKK